MGFDVLHRMLLATSCLVAAPLIVTSSALAAGPSGGTVVVGQATVTNPSSTSTIITQTTNRALINWNSFSISAGSTVTFDQPNSRSITVNRVTGNGASDIFGDLLANGRIWLINANGILFGKGSEINVGALIATTSDMTDEDFRKGRYNFGKASTDSAAAVVNQGTIDARNHGYVVLSGASVSNQGVIQANLGTVVLGGADAFTVDLKGDNLIRYQVTAPVSKTPTAADGSPAAALVSNSGTIQANGGKVLMTARAAHSVEDDVINNSGIVEATSVSSHNGEIDLDAGPDGTVDDSGTLDVSGKGAGETGGRVAMTGGTVNVEDGARIDASGDSGGGAVRIGGNFHGKGKLRDAAQTNIGNATIDVDAITKGNGGTVAVWSNSNTTFAGTISAKGGAHGGNGGFVETSGGSVEIGLNGLVNTSAIAGKSGDWLIDPDNIVIATGGETSLSGGTDGLNNNPDGTDTIDPSTIVNALEGGTDVTLEAGNEITVSNDVIYSSANTLSLLAENTILVNANIENTKASGGGNINLIAGWDGETLPPASLTAPGAYGAQNEEGQGTILIGEDASGGVAVGSASGLTTVAGTDITLQSNDGYTQIGYHGTGGGGIVVDATDDLTLNSGEGGLYAQIGNGDASATNETIGNVGGDIDIHIANDSEFYGATPWIGNVAGVGAIETGNVTLVTDSSDFVPGTFITADLGSAPGTGGNVTVGFMSSGDNYLGGLYYSSPNDFTWLTGGNLNVVGSIVNSGTGAITLVAGWNGQTLGTASQLRSAGAYGANGALTTIGGEYADGDVDVGSAGGATTVLSGDLTLEADSGFAQLGYNGTGGGDINVYLTGDLTLTGNSEESSEYAQIGNGDATGTNDGIGSVTGNIAIDAAGTITFNGYSEEDGGIAWLGNVAGTQGANPVESGNLTLIAASEQDNGDLDLGDMIGDNIGSTSSPSSGGNVTIGFTDPDEGTTIIDNPGSGSTPNNLTVLSTGNIEFEGNFENQGTGSLTLVSGWDTDTITAGDVINTANANNSFVTLFTGAAGSYGQNGGSVTIGGENAEGDTSVGSAGGTTTVLTDNLTVEADNGIAQLGYDGAGDGAIDVSALGNVTVDAASNGYAQIGNGGVAVASAVGGNIDVAAGGAVTVEAIADSEDNQTVAAIGNVGGEGSSQSGNLIVNATGALEIASEGIASDAFIGNGAVVETSGGATGDVTVTAANANIDADGEDSQAFIGDGLRFNQDGTSGGNISLTTGALVLLGDATDGDTSEARIANRGTGAVSGNITVDATGDIELMATDLNLAAIGNGEGGGGTTSGTIGIQSGGNISLVAEDAGEARIAAGAATDTDIDVSAAGNITLSVTGTPEDLETGLQPGFAFIGNFAGNTIGGNITVTSTGGTIDLAADEANSLVQIGNNGIDSASGTVTVTASDRHGNVEMSTTGQYATAQIGNGGPEDTGSAGGDVSVTAGDAVIATTDASDSIVQIGDGGNAAVGDDSGNVTVAATRGDVDLTVEGAGSYMQIGNGGSGFNGDTGGSVTVTAARGNILGDVTINTAYLQIGNGGFSSTGNDSGTITLSALDNIELETSDTSNPDLTGGSYVQVGNGGPASNENSATGFSETGNIAVSAADITLSSSDNTTPDAASGEIIGNGGNCAGCVTEEDVTTAGSVAFGGNITITATTALDMADGGTDTGAQIGNGGDSSGSGLNITSGTLTDSGTITVDVGTAHTAGVLTLTTGSAGDSDLFIGNGGYLSDSGASATGGVSILGDVDVTVNGGGDHGASVTLDASTAAPSLLQVGDNGAAIANGAVTGNVVFTVDGTAELSDTAGVSLALIGDTTGVSSADIGTTLIQAQSISGVEASLANDIMGGDVTLEVTGPGALTLSNPVDYSSSHTLDLLAVGDIDIENSVGNSLASGGGAINVVAGWDGHTTVSGSLTNAGVFGNNDGSVTVGGAGASGDAWIGDNSGTLTVAADNITLDALNGAAQLGFDGGGAGAIDAIATNDITISADTANLGAQIGNGGQGAENNASGDLSVTAGGAIALTASGQNSSAQIGNGGLGAEGDDSGAITVDAANLTMAGAGNSSGAQIGNGGLASAGSASGAVNVTIADAIAMSADGNFGAAQIGNGGPLSNEDTNNEFSDTGNITVAASDIALNGSGVSSDVSIGNGGVFAGSGANIESGSIAFGGTVDVSATNVLALSATPNFASAWIGNGGEGSVLDAILDGGSVTSSGAINVTVGTSDAIGALVMDAEGQGADARIGNGGIFGADANVTASGGVSEGGTVEVSVLGGESHNGTATLTASGDNALVQIGNGDPAQNFGSVSGDTGLTVDGAITLVSAAGAEGNLIGNAIEPSGALSGDVTIGAQSVSGDLGFSIANDLPGGDFTVALTGDDTLTIGSDPDYTSSHTLSLTNGGNIAFTSSVQNAGSGDIDIAAGGDVLIGGEGAAGDVAVGSAGGTLTLTADNITVEADNGYAQLGYHGSGGGDIHATASGDITLTAEQGVPAFYAMIGNGSLGNDVGGHVTGDIYLLTPGNLEFNTCQDCGTPAQAWIGNHANSDGVESGNFTVLIGDEDDNCDSDVCDNEDEFGAMIQAALGSSDVEGSGGNVTIGFTNPHQNDSNAVSIDNGFSYDSPNNLTILSATSIGIGGSLQNSGNGDITLVAGWNGDAVTQGDIVNAVENGDSLAALFTGTANSYGQTNNDDPNHGSIQIGGSNFDGNTAVGSAGGTTTVLTDDLIVEADNGFAQLGYNGAASGAIDVDASGNVSLTGGGATGQYAQIGNGGLLTMGDEGGNITVDAGGAVTLTGGAGQEAYAQIGNGGAGANKNSAGYTNSGTIMVDGDSVALLAGGGSDAYVQIGNGGYDVGDGLTGTGTNTGAITVAAVESVSLTGGGANAYAQIGNGGDKVNANAATSAGGANSGDIMVTVSDAADGSVDLTAGTGTASYAQIGNGGFSSDAPTTATAANFTDSGTVTVSDLTLMGSDTGADGYAQIGNGDSSDNNVGDVSGDINIISPNSIVIDNGTAPGASAMIGGATGDGTVTGSFSGYTPPAPTGTQQQTSTVASLTTQTPTPDSDQTNIANTAPITGPDETGTGDTGSTDNTATSPSPIQQMADASDNGDSNYEGNQPSDTVTVSLGQSLNSGSGGHTKPGATVTHTIIPGVLKQVVMVGTNTPHGVPPADQDYSSWGNEALWQW